MSTALQPWSQPRLASHVRLGFDRVRKQYMLQVPEAVTILNLTGAATLHLCDGRRTVTEIVQKLRDRYDRVDDDEVADFLSRLVAKRWVELDDD
jgi:pyrroloquinoline quinone biosynthesis protein D